MSCILYNKASYEALARSPLFQVLFSLQQASLAAGPLPFFEGLQVSPVPQEEQTTKFDLAFVLTDMCERAESVHLQLEHEIVVVKGSGSRCRSAV